MKSFVRSVVMKPVFTGIVRMESKLFSREDTLHPTDDSPIRFEIVKQLEKRGGGSPKKLIPIMIPSNVGIVQHPFKRVLSREELSNYKSWII